MADSKKDYLRLAKAMQYRWRHLEIPIDEAIERSGLAQSTFMGFFDGKREARPQAPTRAAIEFALRWPPGLVEKILDGRFNSAPQAARMPEYDHSGTERQEDAMPEKEEPEQRDFEGELDRLSTLVRTLESMDRPEQVRVMAYLAARFPTR